MNPADVAISRRGVLRGAATAAGLAVFATGGGAIAVGLPGSPTFLSAAQLKLLSAVVDRVVPGQPEDLAPGAVQAGCPAAIDGLLAAFKTDPPRIFAGAPYSDRGGSPVNYFEDFLPLDPYEERAWRLRIEGAGGFQQVYTRGLAALAKTNPLFAALPGPLRDVALRTTGDADVQAMRDLAVTHTLEFYLAAPEYGGNKDLAGWKAVAFDGDTQPRGFTRDEIDNPKPELLPLVPLPLGDLLSGLVGSLLGTVTGTVSELLTTLAAGSAPTAVTVAAPALALGTAEGMQSVGAAGADHSSVQQGVAALLTPLKDANSSVSKSLKQMHAQAAQLAADARKQGAK